MAAAHILRLLALATCGLCAAASSLAQSPSNGYYFGGLAAGQAQSKMPEERSTTGVIGAGLSAISTLRDDRDLAYKIFAGYQFNNYLALEAGYFNLSSFKFTTLTAPPGALNGDMRVAGLNLDLVGTVPISGNLTGLARVGVQYARTSDAFVGSGALASTTYNLSEHATNLKLGLGLQYAIRPWVALRGEVERYQLKDALGGRGAANVFSLGLIFPFGRSSAP